MGDAQARNRGRGSSPARPAGMRRGGTWIPKLQQKLLIELDFVKNSLEAPFTIRYYSVSPIPHASLPDPGRIATNQIRQ